MLRVLTETYSDLRKSARNLKAKDSTIKESKKRINASFNADLDHIRRKTIMCESTDKLKNDLKTSLTRQKTQDPTPQTQKLLSSPSKPLSTHCPSPLETIKKQMDQCDTKILNFALIAPTVQRHERTPSFLNKLPMDLKKTLGQPALSENSKSNFLEVGDSYRRDSESISSVRSEEEQEEVKMSK